jgi:hypothetical protein
VSSPCLGHTNRPHGSKRLAKLTHDDIHSFLDAKRDAKRKNGKPLAARTLHNLYVALGTALTLGDQERVHRR